MSVAEQWRPVPDYPDYIVSDRGRVVSLKWGKRREMRTFPEPGGHRQVQIGGATPKTFLVHQLVMLAFVGPYPEGMEIRHLDGNPENNALENLKYGTRSQNIQDQIRHGVHHFKSKTHCKHGHPYDEANTYYCSRGWRQCRQCKRDWRAQRMLAAAGVPLLSEAS